MTIVRGGREEQAVLEALGEIPNGPRDLGVDGIALAAGRSGVVRFVQNQEAPGTERTQPVRQRTGVGFVDQQPVRDEETRVRGPGIDPKPTFAANILDVVLVEDFEVEAKAAVQFFPPLEQHRRRAGDNDVAHLLSQQQLAGNQPGLDRLAQANVIRDEQD